MPKENRNGNDPKNNVHISHAQNKNTEESLKITLDSAPDAESPLPWTRPIPRCHEHNASTGSSNLGWYCHLLQLPFLISRFCYRIPTPKLKPKPSLLAVFHHWLAMEKQPFWDCRNAPPHLPGLHLNLLSLSSSPMLIVWLQFYLSTSVCIYKHISTYLSTYHKHSLSFLTLIIWLQFLKRL